MGRVPIRLCLVIASLALCLACSHGRSPPADTTVDAPTDGILEISWQIYDSDQEFLIDCDTVAGTRVSVSTQGATFFAPCADGRMALTLRAGGRDVIVSLVGEDGIVLVGYTRGVALVAGTTSQLALRFDIDPRGVLSFIAVAQGKVANCTPAGSGGGAISSTTVTLTHTGDGCAPIVLTRTSPTATIGYQVDCAAPVIVPCLEANETMRTPRITAGSYTVHIAGRVNAADCWRADQVVLVSPARRVDATIELATLGAPGCP